MQCMWWIIIAVCFATFLAKSACSRRLPAVRPGESDIGKNTGAGKREYEE